MRRTAVILGVMGWLALGLFTGMVVAPVVRATAVCGWQSPRLIRGPCSWAPLGSIAGSVAKFRFWGKIQKSSVRNSMAYNANTLEKATLRQNQTTSLYPESLFSLLSLSILHLSGSRFSRWIRVSEV